MKLPQLAAAACSRKHTAGCSVAAALRTSKNRSRKGKLVATLPSAIVLRLVLAGQVWGGRMLLRTETHSDT